MRYLVVLAFVITYASTQSHGGGHNVVPKKGGISHDNPAPDTGHSWSNPGYVGKVVEPERQAETVNCIDYFQPHVDSIVRTKDSLKAGAVFLSAPSTAGDIDECMGWCQCESEDEDTQCDMVVFESSKKNCYLFRCLFEGENRCLFAHHQGYTSMLFDEKSFTKQKQAASQADELQDLVDDEPTEVPDVTTKKIITTTALITTTEKRKVSCARYEFQCDNGDCIGIYNACDGIPHCLDLSDEKGCSYVKHDESVYPTLKQEDSKLPTMPSENDYNANRNHNSNPRPGTHQGPGQSNDYDDLRNYYEQHYGHNNNNEPHKDKQTQNSHVQDQPDNQRYENWNSGDKDGPHHIKNTNNNHGNSEPHHPNANRFNNNNDNNNNNQYNNKQSGKNGHGGHGDSDASFGNDNKDGINRQEMGNQHKAESDHRPQGGGRNFYELVTARAPYHNKHADPSRYPAPFSNPEPYHYFYESAQDNNDYSNPWYYYNTGGGSRDESEVSEYPEFNNEDHDDDDDDDDGGRYDYDKPAETSPEAAAQTTEPPKGKHHSKGKVETTPLPLKEATKPAKVEAQTAAPGHKSEEVTPQAAAGSTPTTKKSNAVAEKPEKPGTGNQTADQEEGDVDVEELYTNSGRTLPETSAILPLAVGLAITLLLLLMVACRLRMVKRKLRYGRPLHNTQEADYLINGMYL